jgi:hypothetical protein
VFRTGNPLIYKSAYKISFNRPNHRGGDRHVQYSFFGGELQLVQFSGGNGYDMSLHLRRGRGSQRSVDQQPSRLYFGPGHE